MKQSIYGKTSNPGRILFAVFYLILSITLMAQAETNSPFSVESQVLDILISHEKQIPEIPSPWHSSSAAKEFMFQHFGIDAQSDSAEWTSSTLHFANSTLKTLPESFRRHTKGIVRVDKGRNSGVMGYVYMNEAPVIYITNNGANYEVFEGYLVHEMTHCFQMANPEVMRQWEKQFWDGMWFWKAPKPPSVTNYGNSDPKEDMAESVRIYWENGPMLKRNFPDRYEFIKNHVMDGVEYSTPKKD